MIHERKQFGYHLKYIMVHSIAAAAVAAHECGHAIQDAEGYAFLRFAMR